MSNNQYPFPHMHDTNHVAVLDFGSQYTQLIVRRVRELGYFAKLYAIEDFPDIGKPGAIILSGGPKSTSEPDAPDLDFAALKAFGVPVLGVCYGMQLLNIKFGGSVKASNRREYGPATLVPGDCSGLYEGVSKNSQVWMSHSDTVENLPACSVVIAANQHGTPVSLKWEDRFYGIQFHPQPRGQSHPPQLPAHRRPARAVPHRRPQARDPRRHPCHGWQQAGRLRRLRWRR